MLLAVPACDLSTGADGPGLGGDWITFDYTLTHAEQADQVRLIPDQGWFRYLSLSPSGYLEDNEWSWTNGWNRRNGDWVATDTILATAYAQGGTAEWRYDLLPGDRLRLSRSQPRGYDFDGDGTADPTVRTLELIRADANPDGAILAAWTADSYTFTAAADGATYDLVAGGGSYEVTFFHTGIFRSTEERPGEEARTRDGDFAALVGLVWLIDGARVDLGHYHLDDGTLVLTFDRAEWDFDGDGVPDPATAVVRLTESG